MKHSVADFSNGEITTVVTLGATINDLRRLVSARNPNVIETKQT